MCWDEVSLWVNLNHTDSITGSQCWDQLQQRWGQVSAQWPPVNDLSSHIKYSNQKLWSKRKVCSQWWRKTCFWLLGKWKWKCHTVRVILIVPQKERKYKTFWWCCDCVFSGLLTNTSHTSAPGQTEFSSQPQDCFLWRNVQEMGFVLKQFLNLWAFKSLS